MPIPKSTIPAKSRVRRKRKVVVSNPPPSGPPVLLEGLFNRDDGVWVQLTFDRAISVATLVPSTIVVIDPGLGGSYGPTGSPTIDGVTITMNLTLVGGWSGTQTVLNASTGSGIKNASDGSAWAGVSGFVLEIND